MIGNLKILIFCTLFVSLLSSSFAQTKEQISMADSLFINQKYTEAFDIYEEIFLAGNISESMFLKMAFIKEGLGDYVQSLYYLDQYYNLTADKSVLLKMQELAEENGLGGYDVGDKDFFMNFLNLYRSEIQIGLLVICVFLLVFSYQSKKKNHLPVGVPVLQVLLLAVLLIVSNDWLQKDTEIIQIPTLLMSGPSAGSEPIGWVVEGHKIEVLDRSEVWTKISWKNEEAYIRNSKLQVAENAKQ